MQKAMSFWVVEDDVKFVFVCLLLFFHIICCFQVMANFCFYFQQLLQVVAFVWDACFVVWFFLRKCFNELRTRSWVGDEDKRSIVEDNAKLQEVENVLKK